MLQSITIALLAALPTALADFKVFCGDRCVQDAGGCAPTCIFMNNPASCSDVDNSVNFQIQDDVSGCGGVACDGCDQALPPADWTITRLEINNAQNCNPSVLYWANGGDDPHFTLYNDGGVVNILDVDNNNLGTCNVPADPQVVQCGGVFGNSGLANVFDCVSPLEFLRSAN